MHGREKGCINVLHHKAKAEATMQLVSVGIVLYNAHAREYVGLFIRLYN